MNFDHIARHYYTSHLRLNPSGIVPVGPAMDWARATWPATDASGAARLHPAGAGGRVGGDSEERTWPWLKTS